MKKTLVLASIALALSSPAIAGFKQPVADPAPPPPAPAPAAEPKPEALKVPEPSADDTARQKAAEAARQLDQPKPDEDAPKPAEAPKAEPAKAKKPVAKVPVQPKSYRGTPMVVNTGLLRLNGVEIRLAGVDASEDQRVVGQMQAWIEESGFDVNCTEVKPASARYTCKTMQGDDLAAAAIYNGAAMASTDAGKQLKTLHAAARDAHRGLWAPRNN